MSRDRFARMPAFCRSRRLRLSWPRDGSAEAQLAVCRQALAGAVLSSY
jgi:hypothetical protein